MIDKFIKLSPYLIMCTISFGSYMIWRNSFDKNPALLTSLLFHVGIIGFALWLIKGIFKVFVPEEEEDVQ